MVEFSVLALSLPLALPDTDNYYAGDFVTLILSHLQNIFASYIAVPRNTLTRRCKILQVRMNITTHVTTTTSAAYASTTCTQTHMHLVWYS